MRIKKNEKFRGFNNDYLLFNFKEKIITKYTINFKNNSVYLEIQ